MLTLLTIYFVLGALVAAVAAGYLGKAGVWSDFDLVMLRRERRSRSRVANVCVFAIAALVWPLLLVPGRW